jgi:hypothetical protein
VGVEGTLAAPKGIGLGEPAAPKPVALPRGPIRAKVGAIRVKAMNFNILMIIACLNANKY